jgi:hypothetical protein
MPDALTTRFDDLVLVVGEANAWPYADATAEGAAAGAAAGRPVGGDAGRAARKTRDELVHWAALRPATGELFERIAAPIQPLSPSTTFHAGLTEDELRSGCSHADLLAAFAGFLRPTDVVASWGEHGPSLFAAAGGVLPARIDLRAVGQRLTHKRLGGLEVYAASQSAPLPTLPIAGRAGRRLAMLARIVASWRAEHATAAADDAADADADAEQA